MNFASIGVRKRSGILFGNMENGTFLLESMISVWSNVMYPHDYYGRDLIIIEKVEVNISIQGQKGKSIKTIKRILNIF